MKPYNVEIFDRDMNFVCNTLVEECKYKSDYMDPETFKLDLIGCTAGSNYFIKISRDDENYIGIITQKEEIATDSIRVTVAEISSLWNARMLIDADAMTGSLEHYIKARISELYLGSDTTQNLPLEIAIESNTTDWTIDVDVVNEPEEGEESPTMRAAYVNLFDDIILNAFTQYQIVVDYSVNLNRKKVVVLIHKNTTPTMVIEADLPNVLEKKIVVRKAKKQVNKVVVYNSEDFTTKKTYYLHSDDTFNESDTDRLSPVCYELTDAAKETTNYKTWKYNGTEYDNKSDAVEAAKAAGGSSKDVEEIDHIVVVKTFAEAAYEKAEACFLKNKYTNYIELETFLSDSLIKPTALKVGQVVRVISDGNVYESILSGREVNTTTKLIFGTVRLELTKYLKGRN